MKENNFPLQLFELAPGCLYSLDEVARLTHVPCRSILMYSRQGLISTAVDPVVSPEWGGYYFAPEAINRLRCIEHLRVAHGINVAGIKLVLAFWRAAQGRQFLVNSFPRML